jgi:type IV pilus assembly protein PilB
MDKQDAITSYLIREQIIDQDTLSEILKQQSESGQSLIGILKQKGLLSEDELIRVVSASQGIEFVNLSADMIDPMVSHMLSYDMVNRHNVIPIKKQDDCLVVAMSSPLNLSVRDQIENKTGYKVIPVAATISAIKSAIRYHFNVKDVTRQEIVSMRFKNEGDKFERVQQETIKADTPITRLVASIINGAIDSRASDIHIEPQQPDMRVRYRVDGMLRDALSIPSSVQSEVISHIKISANMDISEQRVPQDGYMYVYYGGKEYDLRVSSLPVVGGEKIVVRILDKNVEKWSLDTVVASPDDNRKFHQLVSNPYGMLLLTGPTGCGKTTTLYSVLQLLNKPHKNIVTIEDPVEYHLDGITQVQVRPAAGMTFAPALRSILRQDPDIILVGEIRDLETAEIAISAALTGHFVLSTLHTNDAAGAISRLINLGVKPFLIASALLGAVAQRLIRVVCDNCKQTYQAGKEEIGYLFGENYEGKSVEACRATGCRSCGNTGYHGRKGVFEILTVSPRIKQMIIQQNSSEQIKMQAVKEGMRTLHQSATEEVIKGATTIEELLRVVDVREQ